FREEPRLAENYIRLLSARIHFLSEKITTLTRSGSKLQQYLLNEYRLHGQENRVTLSYNMAELARVLGIGRTTLYRELSDLEEAGIIKKNGKTVTVLKLEELS
ncbi:MAG: Crp/Fnr family transcriptional regulator, partial [Clostridia bacterium]|nr:Crp/Fnr family transcriptional regulator [Clostridia bacterium]